MFINRIKKLRTKIREQELEGILITNLNNCRYLSGFTGSSVALFITDESAILMTDFRYREQAANQAPNFQIEQVDSNFNLGLSNLINKIGLERIGFETEYISYAVYYSYFDTIRTTRLIPTEGLVEEIRMEKDEQEIQLIKKAAAIADNAFNYIITQIKPGVTEKFLAWELEKFMRENGAEKLAFDTIIASGERGALPHGLASERKIQRGDLVTLDFGAVFNGYNSDLTRTVAVGVICKEQKEVYELVLESQKKAIDELTPGSKGKEIDAVARRIIAGKGYSQYFGHGLGHGVGLEVHEQPRLNKISEVILKPGMVVTIEPGVYIPNRFGLRIEDMAVLTEEGCEILTATQKELIII